jgi:hypothetical protein
MKPGASMKKILVLASILVLPFVFMDLQSFGRGRGGGGAGRGGGFGGGAGRGGGVVHSYGGFAGARPTTPIVGPGGGAGHAGRGGGSFTTKGGSTIDYKGAAIGGAGPGGGQAGRYVGGIQITTPGGKEVTRIGHGGAVAGPGGAVAGSKSGITAGTGPQGSFASKYQGGVAIGPQGGVAGKSKVGVATGPGGTAVGGSRAGIVGTPYGAVAGRTGFVSGQRGTYYRSAAVIRGQGVYVRQAVAHYPCFRPGWYTRYPGAWFAAGWAAGAVWRAATWGVCSNFGGYSGETPYYDYGENVVYQDDGVYMDGQKTFSAEEYAQQSMSFADAGRAAKVSNEDEWLPLGVFAMVKEDEKTSNHIFQLAMNKQGIIRGNYYDAVTDSTAQVYGSVDASTGRAAWTVGERKTPVYEAGIANLTKNETTMMVHYGQDRSQQFTLIRIEEPQSNGEKSPK